MDAIEIEELMREFSKLKGKKADLNKQIKPLQKRMDAIHCKVLDAMKEQQITEVKLRGTINGKNLLVIGGRSNPGHEVRPWAKFELRFADSKSAPQVADTREKAEALLSEIEEVVTEASL